MKCDELLSDRDLRNQCAERYDILEKVKKLLLIPGTVFATTQQVAEYYEVDIEVVKKILLRNHEELEQDGIIIKKGSDIINILDSDMKSLSKQKDYNTSDIVGILDRDTMSLTKHKGYVEINNIRIAHVKNTLFPRRAILRVGMLLRDSTVAKEVRTQLLNIEEKSAPDIKIADITEEQSLALALGMALASGELTAITIATGKLMEFKNWHINKLKQDNRGLAGENIGMEG